MKLFFTLIAFVFTTNSIVYGQSTFERVYNILETKCSSPSCHGNGTPVLNLDLEGSGPTAMMDVYNNIVNVETIQSLNSNDRYIKPGDPARSFLFRKINNGLDATLSLHADEGGSMPQTGGALDEEEIELVRQWILHGAPATGEVIDVALIESFYATGIQSVPNPPAKPDPSEGFQLHLGPFFVAPNQEREVFLKHELFLENDIEVVGVETTMGVQSHHFIMNKFLEANATVCGIPLGNDGPDVFPEGFRDVNASSHFSALFQVGAQESGRLDLPYKTAFSWEEGTVLDLNSHYINMDQNQVLAAELYVNVYTQEAGIAKQEMQSLMLPNTDINLPNDGIEKTLTATYPMFTCLPSGGYLWSVSSHTHELGKDFDIYKSNSNGDNLEHIFDASCLQDGLPGCSSTFYDYQHPPTREFDDYYKVSNADWIKMEAKYVNNTNQNVGFGLTSEDEMMIMFLFFLEDTTGLHNAAPIAEADQATTDQGQAIIINVLENDNDDDDLLLIGIATDPTNGMVEVNGDGTLTYTPNAGFSGTDQFDYIVCDDIDPPLCDTATVTVSVTPSTGIFDNNFKLVNAYPNPTTGLVSLVSNNEEISSIQLLSIQGQVIRRLGYEKQAGLLKVNLNNEQLPNGIYWMVIENKDQSRRIAKIVYAK